MEIKPITLTISLLDARRISQILQYLIKYGPITQPDIELFTKVYENLEKEIYGNTLD